MNRHIQLEDIEKSLKARSDERAKRKPRVNQILAGHREGNGRDRRKNRELWSDDKLTKFKNGICFVDGCQVVGLARDHDLLHGKNEQPEKIQKI